MSTASATVAAPTLLEGEASDSANKVEYTTKKGLSYTSADGSQSAGEHICRNRYLTECERVPMHYEQRKNRLTPSNKFARAFQVRVVNKRVFKSKRVVFLDCL